MRVRNNENFNTSCNTGRNEVGQAPRFLNIPAGATIELDDAEWKLFAPSAKGMLSNGILEITKAPALSEEEVEAKRVAGIAAAEKLLADNQAAEKAKAEAAKKAATK